MSKKVFPTPDETLISFPKPLISAINSIKDRINKGDLKFKPSYEVTKFQSEIRQLLSDSNWNLNVDGENNWTITPKF